MHIETIKEIRLFRCPVKLKEPFIISLGKLEYADNVFVIIRTSGGITGYGECSPFQTIHGENGETCMAVGKILANTILGKNAIDIENCSTVMDTVIFGNTSIKSAFDIALYDIASQKASLPLFRFLGGENNKEIFTDYTVSVGPADKMAADAQKISDAGFPVIKVKLGGTEEQDFLRIKTIREKVGYEIPMRIDANQGWSVDTAKKLLDRLFEFNIQHCEEPLSRNNFMALPELKKMSRIPLMADESCFDHHDAKRLVNLKACDFFNIKLGKSSGIFKAIKIVRLAEENGINMQAGGFLESRLGFTATAHLSLCSERFIYFDFDTPLMFSEDPVAGGIKYGSNGKINVPIENGLGATVSEDVLKRLEKIVVD